MAIWPFIISRASRKELGETVIRHEKIHFRQQLELAFVFFFLVYALEYFYLLLRLKDKHLAYRSISFEKEAYDNEEDLNYLKNRKVYCWIQYWK